MTEQELLEVEQSKGLDWMSMSNNPEHMDYAMKRIDGELPEPNQQIDTSVNNESFQQEQQQELPAQQGIQAQQDMSGQQQNIQAQQPVENNVFTTKYMGNEVSMADDDGYMNRSDLSGLKNAFIHNNEHIRTLNNQMAERDNLARSEIQKILKEKEEMAKKYEELKAAQDQAQQSYQQPFQQANPQAMQQSFQQPVQQQGYQSQQPSFQAQTNQYGQQVESPLSGDALDWDENQIGYLNNNIGKVPTLEKDLLSVKEQLQQYQALQKQEEESRRILEEQKVANEKAAQFENEVNTFVKKNSYFSDIGDDVMKYDSMANGWMENVATANGVHRPFVNDPAAIKDYESKKLEIAQRYINGDTLIMSNASHINKPKGIEKYYELSNLLKNRDENYKFSDNRSISLDEAWVLEQNRNGNLQNGVQNAVQSAYKEGAQAMANVQSNVANHAVNLPNSASQSNNAAVDITKLTTEQFENLINADPLRLSKNPELMRQYEAAQKHLLSMQEETY